MVFADTDPNRLVILSLGFGFSDFHYIIVEAHHRIRPLIRNNFIAHGFGMVVHPRESAFTGDTPMFDRNQFLESIRHETKVLKHIHGKIPEGTMDFRLSDGSRNTEELLNYIGSCGWLPTYCAIHGWDKFKEVHSESGDGDVAPADFPAQADRQAAKIEEILVEVSDEDLTTRKVTYPWGGEAALGDALVNTTLKFMTAYRMQLFLHAKAAGAKGMSTQDCWLGQDLK
ncbi:MAG: hypothetical protein ACI97A_000306 [Planctomycetota bacterium]|jgi:hypothetical protein